MVKNNMFVTAGHNRTFIPHEQQLATAWEIISNQPIAGKNSQSTASQPVAGQPYSHFAKLKHAINNDTDTKTINETNTERMFCKETKGKNKSSESKLFEELFVRKRHEAVKKKDFLPNLDSNFIFAQIYPNSNHPQVTSNSYFLAMKLKRMRYNT